MWNVFRRKSRDSQAEIARIEEELAREPLGEVDTLDGLFERYGRNASESRTMSPTLRLAVQLARDAGRWAEAVPVFREEAALQPDYDVPYLWLADFLHHEGHTDSAITFAGRAAVGCRRKCDLLEQAAEFALFSGEVRESVQLYAASIATMGRPPRPGEVSRQRAFLFMAELFDVFGDAPGTRWARRIQDFTSLDDDYVRTIRSAAEEADAEERARIVSELPDIREHLMRRISGNR